MNELSELNDAQREAVTTLAGPTLIVAGPGTGKTKTLTTRIVWLIRHEAVVPQEVVALTFTNKAAREIRERLKKFLPTAEPLPLVTTFHALGADLLKRRGELKPLVSEERRNDIIRSVHKPASLSTISTRELGLFISRAKTAPAGVVDIHTRTLLKRYDTILASESLLDFDDLLVKVLELLRTSNSKRPIYTYILVDEFQDTSGLQYEFLKLLGAHGNIFAIGDPNQSIYAFRGAGADMFERFHEDFPETREVHLTLNYRSSPEIVKAANAVFPLAPQLEPSKIGPGSVRVIRTLNEYSEAAYILDQVERGIGGSTMLKARERQTILEPRDFAVLYRTRRAGRKVQRAFEEAGLPYQVAGEGSPYERPDVQAVIALMHYIDRPSESLKRTLLRLPGLKYPSPRQLNALLVKLPRSDGLTVCELAERIGALTAPSMEHNLQQLLGTLVQFGACDSGLALCLKYLDSLQESEFYDPSVNAVTLMTIHAAKGLEFNSVFLCAAEEGILPKIIKSEETNMPEERRMFYVALTRAKESLEILYTTTRDNTESRLSHFVEEIPDNILPRTVDPEMARLKKRAEKQRYKRAQSSLF